MDPVEWEWALFVLGYALAWFVVNDRVKPAAYRIFDLGSKGVLGAASSREGST